MPYRILEGNKVRFGLLKSVGYGALFFTAVENTGGKTGPDYTIKVTIGDYISQKVQLEFIGGKK